MPVFKYKAINSEGNTVDGTVDAESVKTASDKLKKDGFFPSSIDEVQKGESSGFSLFKGVSTAELAVSTRQFSTLISAGLPLEASLTTLSEQTEDKNLSQVLSQVRDKVSEGGSLANSLKDHNNVFSDIYTSIVRAGEASGNLDVVLLRLADFLEKQAALRSKVRSAFVYPIFMFLIGSGVLAFMMTFVIPRITKIFEESKKALPLMTVILINTSNFITEYYYLIFIFTAGLGYILYRYTKTEKGREQKDRLSLKIPIFGKINRMVILARFTRTLGTLLASGIPLLDALRIGGEVSGNQVYINSLSSVSENVKEGTSLARPLEQSGVFPPMMTRMIAVGEQTGELEEMLDKVADSYDQQVETTMSALTSLLEPVMIVVMGGIVGFIVFAILLPIFDITSTISR
ncbi:MAG: type II secretion system inner membrane protein GspF [Candidatus Dadabacteria bacterium]|nr:type II secretion system inner membrane protein GspF [Candidatus Dadabacteria bacterium]NIS07359.1 type II secretion system inner membrane protein GspF [Candidatus Dadabacteria bacterium]NIV41303.1 type II secretion system inner membrane protein GspF [Candidatus Dadabacteria bacterium]NIX14538.1 type II secretion system inner membrane protein GspF [Candidatus Dadabacteria bacterium]NIY20996.1 type II secretion system inner membrane protein GspF [Candidatus Dadabacteria bacterium]